MFSNLENTNGSVLVSGNETSLLQNNVTSNHTSPYEPPVEIVVLIVLSRQFTIELLESFASYICKSDYVKLRGIPQTQFTQY